MSVGGPEQESTCVIMVCVCAHAAEEKGLMGLVVENHVHPWNGALAFLPHP